MFSACNIHYDIADRTRGLGYGGIGAMHKVAKQTGLSKAIDAKLDLLKRHLPANIKERIVIERQYKNIRLHSEDVSEFAYRPTRCNKTCRIVVLRKGFV